MKQRIFLNGPIPQFDDEVRERFKVAEAAMRVKYPKAYIFNTYEYMLYKFEDIEKRASAWDGKMKPVFKNLEQDTVRIKMYDALEEGVFTHLVLMEGWFRSFYSRKAVNMFGIFAEEDKTLNTHLITLTYEDEMSGREYLYKQELTSKQ